MCVRNTGGGGVLTVGYRVGGTVGGELAGGGGVHRGAALGECTGGIHSGHVVCRSVGCRCEVVVVG